MRALIQRVERAEVRSSGEAVAAIGIGLVVLLGVGHDDDEATADALARRIVELRIFRDEAGKTNRSILDVAGGALVVSQFTLYADTSRGRRPGFTDAAPPDARRASLRAGRGAPRRGRRGAGRDGDLRRRDGRRARQRRPVHALAGFSREVGAAATPSAPAGRGAAKAAASTRSERTQTSVSDGAEPQRDAPARPAGR